MIFRSMTFLAASIARIQRQPSRRSAVLLPELLDVSRDRSLK
jgi:hypothetical protein